MPLRHPQIPRAIRPSALRRRLRHLYERLTLLSGWTWVAAASLVGFETFDIIFGAFLLAPEFLPLAIAALALIWFFRERFRAYLRRLRIRMRAARAARE